MDETVAPFQEEPSACPFVALEDDRDRRSDRPDYRHRCFASRQPEPRAFPHQERYCLAKGFTECPIFLDWARRETAAVIPSRRPRTAPAEEDADVAAAAAAAGISDAEPDVPPFLAGRRTSGRAIAEEEPEPAPQPEEGLWGADAGRQKRGPVVGKARPNVKHPDWEEAPRQESYPRLRSRSRSLEGGGGLHIPPMAALVVIVAAAALVAFLVLPGAIPRFGSSGSPTPTSAPPSATPVVTPSPTPIPKPTAFDYIVRSGDTLTSISAKFNVAIEDIMAANPELKNPDDIKEGQRLHIPSPSATPGPSTKASPTKTP